MSDDQGLLVVEEEHTPERRKHPQAAFVLVAVHEDDVGRITALVATLPARHVVKLRRGSPCYTGQWAYVANSANRNDIAKKALEVKGGFTVVADPQDVVPGRVYVARHASVRRLCACPRTGPTSHSCAQYAADPNQDIRGDVAQEYLEHLRRETQVLGQVTLP